MSVNASLKRIEAQTNRILRAAGEDPITFEIYWPDDPDAPTEPDENTIILTWPGALTMIFPQPEGGTE